MNALESGSALDCIIEEPWTSANLESYDWLFSQTEDSWKTAQKYCKNLQTLCAEHELQLQVDGEK